MQIAVSDAKAQLTDLVRRAEAGEEVILTRRGQATVRLVPVAPASCDEETRWQLLKAMQGRLKGKPGMEGVTAANAAAFLYNDKGLPA